MFSEPLALEFDFGGFVILVGALTLPKLTFGFDAAHLPFVLAVAVR